MSREEALGPLRSRVWGGKSACLPGVSTTLYKWGVINLDNGVMDLFLKVMETPGPDFQARDPFHGSQPRLVGYP